VVSEAEGLLLHDRRPGLRDHSLTTDNADNPTHALPYAAAHAASHPAAYAAAAATSSHPATFAATHSAASPCRAR